MSHKFRSGREICLIIHSYLPVSTNTPCYLGCGPLCLQRWLQSPKGDAQTLPQMEHRGLLGVDAAFSGLYCGVTFYFLEQF